MVPKILLGYEEALWPKQLEMSHAIQILTSDRQILVLSFRNENLDFGSQCTVALSNPMGVKQDTIEWRCSANLCFCIPLKMYASLCPSSKHTRLLLLECNYLAKRLFAKFAFWICIYFASSKLTYKRKKNDYNILV